MMALADRAHPNSRPQPPRLRRALLLLLGLLNTASNGQQAAAPQLKPPPPATAASTDDAKARLLLAEMVTALGGDAWLDIQDTVIHGRVAAFYMGNPTEQITPFWAFHRAPDQDRIELTKKRDIIDIYTPGEGVEITYKGRQYLPKEMVEDQMRRRAHSIEAVARVWMRDPAAACFYMGTEMVGRRQADKVRIVNAANDSITLDLNTEDHLPLARTFRWRNSTYKDYDEDREEYDGYQAVQGFQTAFSISRYRNGDLAEQRYIISAQYNAGLPAEMFDPANTPLPRR